MLLKILLVLSGFVIKLVMVKLRDAIVNSDINNLIIAGDMNAADTGKEGSGLI